jgi:cytoskeletal protein CcmA (bactofilin family)
MVNIKLLEVTMFKKWGLEEEIENNGNGDKSATAEVPANGGAEVRSENKEQSVKSAVSKRSNAILKGSKLTGDITVTSDLELSGEVVGSITSAKDSNIILKGTCKGNIDTKEGSVVIEGALEGGSISAGKEVSVSGKFNGEGIKAGEKIYVNGEFNGRLEAKDIEIGPKAVGKGELHYKEFISIARGAKVDVQIGQAQPELKVVDRAPAKKVEESAPVKEEKKEARQG